MIVGSAMREGATVETHNNTKGLVRAFDVRTGKKLWHVQHDSAAGRVRQRHLGERIVGDNGNVGVWTQITVDEELGLVVPAGRDAVVGLSTAAIGPATTCSPRASSAVDLKTGQRKWHFQFVHHPIWNFDMSSAPILADITVDGRADQGRGGAEQAGAGSTSSIASPASRCGRSRRRPVPQSDVPGEKTSPTQPHPTEAAARTRATTSRCPTT